MSCNHQRIKLRRDTYANFSSNQTVLEEGEPAYVTDLKRLYIGNGTDELVDLPYIAMIETTTTPAP